MRRFLPVILLATAATAAQDGPVSAEAEYHLAQGLERMGFSFSAFAHYAAIVSAGNASTSETEASRDPMTAAMPPVKAVAS